MKVLRYLLLAGAVLVAARPAEASSITILIGDKDGFGSGVAPGGTATWPGYPGPLADNRSAGEASASNGAQLTDLYSALYYYGQGSGCSPATDPGCSPNGDHGSVIFSLSGPLVSGSITMLMGDFECSLYGAMNVDINGVGVPFCFDDGFQGTRVRTFTLTAPMIAAANLSGQIQMNFDHSGGYDQNGIWFGSFDYIAFDYFELNGEAVPEPATWTLIGLGLTAIAARRITKGPSGVSSAVPGR